MESSKNVEESEGREEKQDLLSSGIKGKTSFPELRVSLSQALQVRNIEEPGTSF